MVRFVRTTFRRATVVALALSAAAACTAALASGGGGEGPIPSVWEWPRGVPNPPRQLIGAPPHSYRYLGSRRVPVGGLGYLEYPYWRDIFGRHYSTRRRVWVIPQPPPAAPAANPGAEPARALLVLPPGHAQPRLPPRIDLPRPLPRYVRVRDWTWDRIAFEPTANERATGARLTFTERYSEYRDTWTGEVFTVIPPGGVRPFGGRTITMQEIERANAERGFAR